MPSYCTRCGAQLAGAFCSKCGQRAQDSVAPAQPQPALQPAGVAPKSSGLGKALVITGGILLFLCAIGTAGVLYGTRWVKNKMSDYTGLAAGRSGRQVTVAHGSSCALLSREDLQQVLGVTIEKDVEMMEGSEPGCAYYTNSDGFAQLQRLAFEQARRDTEQAAQRPGPKSENPLELLKYDKDLEGVVKTFGLSRPVQEGRVFGFTVQRDFGRRNWPTLRATMSALPGFEEVPGVGDLAMIAPFGHAFYVLKGDSMISLELTLVPNARTLGAELGRRIASRL